MHENHRDGPPAAISQRFISSLQVFLQHYTECEDLVKGGNEKYHSFRLRMIFLITSYLPKRQTESLSTTLKNCIQYYEEHQGVIDEIMTWRTPVFQFIMTENICSSIVLAKLLEKWIDFNKQEFLWFYTSKSNGGNSTNCYQIANSLLVRTRYTQFIQH